jgi:hypothetical protein
MGQGHLGEIEILGKKSGTTDASNTNRIKEMEETI